MKILDAPVGMDSRIANLAIDKLEPSAERDFPGGTPHRNCRVVNYLTSGGETTPQPHLSAKEIKFYCGDFSGEQINLTDSETEKENFPKHRGCIASCLLISTQSIHLGLYHLLMKTRF